MKQNVFKTANEAFCTIINELNTTKNSPQVAPRGLKIKEQIQCHFCLEDPSECIVGTPGRNISEKYLAREFMWYCSASLENVDFICKAAPFWKNLVEDGKLYSNYGYYCFSEDLLPDRVSQFEYCRKLLIDDRDTRQAVININSVNHKKRPAQKDFPCTVYLQFFIRNDKLHMTVNMRSCDIVLGFCNDVFQFSLFQQLMLNVFNFENENPVGLGHMYWNIGSVHVYEKHFCMSEELDYSASKSFHAKDLSMNDVVRLGNIALGKATFDDYYNKGKESLDLILKMQL